MIVQINENNSDKYRKLFTEAYEFLESLNNGSVTSGRGQFSSLAEYYGHIADLFDQQKYEYIMVPLDEDPFEINLNTRTITVPRGFSKCASVQTDMLAETIIFISDRYFDYMDLANTEIYVQWTAPDGFKGATRVEMKDLESEPGKIKFAWPLNDAITKVPGVVKFAVRFFRITNDSSKELVYSLNTLDSEIIIKAALQPNGPSEIESPVNDNWFKKAIVNSNYAATGVNPPVQPIYTNPGTDIAIMAADEDGTLVVTPVSSVTNEVGYMKMSNMTAEKFAAGKYFILADGKYVEATKFDEDETYFIEIMQGVKYVGLEEDTITLYVQAIAADAGEISYKWYYQAQDGQYNDKPYDCENYGGITGNKFGTVNHEVYLEVKNPQDIAHEIYYEKTSDGAYKEYTGVIPANKPLYEKFSTFTVPASGEVTGLYHAAAWNTIDASGYSKVDNLTEDRFNANTYYVKSGNTYVVADSFDEDQTYFTKIDKHLTTNLPTESSTCLLPGPRPIVVSKDLETGAIFAVPENGTNALVSLSVEIEDDDYRPDISYDWRMSKVSKDNVFKDTTDSITSDNSKTYIVKETGVDNGLGDGWYGVAITSRLNRKGETRYSNIIKITHDPIPPKVLFIDDTDKIFGKLTSADSTVNFTVDVDATNLDVTDELLSENIEYVWQMSLQDQGWNTLTGKESGININGNTLTVNGNFGYIYASFRCLVINTLNGKKAIFDHSSAFEPTDDKLGTFAKEPPYIFEDNKSFEFVISNTIKK